MGDRFCIKTETGLKPVKEIYRGLVKPELLVPCGEEEKPPVEPKDVYYKDFEFNLNGQVGNLTTASLIQGVWVTRGVWAGDGKSRCNFGPIEPIGTISLEHLRPVDDPAKHPKALDEAVGKK